MTSYTLRDDDPVLKSRCMQWVLVACPTQYVPWKEGSFESLSSTILGPLGSFGLVTGTLVLEKLLSPTQNKWNIVTPDRVMDRVPFITCPTYSFT